MMIFGGEDHHHSFIIFLGLHDIMGLGAWASCETYELRLALRRMSVWTCVCHQDHEDGDDDDDNFLFFISSTSI